jgi:hypothetical protein
VITPTLRDIEHSHIHPVHHNTDQRDKYSGPMLTTQPQEHDHSRTRRDHLQAGHETLDPLTEDP